MSNKNHKRQAEQSPELDSLKKRADMIGLKYHPNIGLDKLRTKVNDKLKGEPEAPKEPEISAPESTSDFIGTSTAVNNNISASGETSFVKRETPAQRKARVRKLNTRLVRIRLVCMNPNKKEWNGEIITVINNTIGTVKRFVPFSAPAWHVEQCILDVLQERKFTKHFSVKSKSGRPVTRQSQEKEFAIEILPNLTPKEIDELAKEQAISGRIVDEV